MSSVRQMQAESKENVSLSDRFSQLAQHNLEGLKLVEMIQVKYASILEQKGFSPEDTVILLEHELLHDHDLLKDLRDFQNGKAVSIIRWLSAVSTQDCKNKGDHNQYLIHSQNQAHARHLLSVLVDVIADHNPTVNQMEYKDAMMTIRNKGDLKQFNAWLESRQMAPIEKEKFKFAKGILPNLGEFFVQDIVSVFQRANVRRDRDILLQGLKENIEQVIENDFEYIQNVLEEKPEAYIRDMLSSLKKKNSDSTDLSISTAIYYIVSGLKDWIEKKKIDSPELVVELTSFMRNLKSEMNVLSTNLSFMFKKMSLYQIEGFIQHGYSADVMDERNKLKECDLVAFDLIVQRIVVEKSITAINQACTEYKKELDSELNKYSRDNPKRQIALDKYHVIDKTQKKLNANDKSNQERLAGFFNEFNKPENRFVLEKSRTSGYVKLIKVLATIVAIAAAPVTGLGSLFLIPYLWKVNGSELAKNVDAIQDAHHQPGQQPLIMGMR